VERQLRVAASGASLAVSLSPADSDVLLALHGASSGLRSHFLYTHLHRVLPPIGVGVATFDRRGDGESSGEPSVGNFRLQADDALSVLQAVGGHGGLWGFSQGGWVAPLASTLSSKVEFLVLVASCGVTPSAQMMYAVGEQLQRAGQPQKVIDRVLALRSDLAAWIHEPDLQRRDELARELQAARAEPWWDWTFLPEQPPDTAARRAWCDEMDFDPAPVFANVRVPTLLFYGTDDAWTPVASSIAAWKQARGDEVEICIVEGASHEMTLPNGELSHEYENRLVEWLISIGAGARQTAVRA
jgi:pimeloyl-ACP methyl ester carboxylesterase